MSNFYFSEALSIYSSVTDGTHDSPKPTSDGKKLITSKHIKGRNIDFETAYFISENDFELINKRSKVNQWDVIISMIGEYCGFCFIERNKLIDYAVKNVGLFKTGCELEAKWLYYYLNSPIGKLYLSKSKSGSSQPYLTLGGLRNLKILNCNNNLKRKIVSTLSALDDKIELNNKINAELEAMAKTLYDYWFVQFDFPDANGKPYKSSGGKMVYNEVLKREIPEGWEVKSLEYISDIVGGSTPSKEVDEHFTQTRGMPWITPKDLSLNTGNKYIEKGELNVTELGMKSASLRIMPKGTVLMSSRAPIGYMAISSNQVTTNQGFKSFVPKNGFPSEFIYYLVKNLLPQIVNNASGSTFKEVSGSVLKSLDVCIPGKKLIEEYHVKVSSIFIKQEIIERENQELSTLRDWLLPMLMNGQVSVGKAYGEVEEVLSVAAEDGALYKTK
jgi:type I restriction enzyme S subunit